MLFKGTATRSAEDIAQAIDSIGGQLDAFTAKEYASYYIKVLDEHLPLAVDLLSDIVMHPGFRAPTISSARRRSILEEIKMVEDTPDDLVHELFTQRFWEGHALGPADSRHRRRRSSRSPPRRCATTSAASYVAPQPDRLGGRQPRARPRARAGRPRRSARCRQRRPVVADEAPRVSPQVIVRAKELEQSHVCLGTSSYPQKHDDRYVSYILNTVLGGSMSSRLFQNVREKRGLAYAVFSGLSAYRDAGNVHDLRRLRQRGGAAKWSTLCVEELRGMKQAPVPDAELRRAKDHLKGSLMLSLENTASRMSHLARQEIYFDRHFGLDETLAGVERVTAADVQRVATDLFANGSLAATVVGPSPRR